MNLESNTMEDKRFEIFTYVKSYIKKNNLSEGDRIPSQNTLSELFDVNRNTVRSALTQLCAQGLIYSQKGKGFFVKVKNKPILFEHENGMGFSEILNNGKREYE
jgi:GntR family transcriptional regulator